MFPDQLTSWLGTRLATEGRVPGILFPHITAEAAPRLVALVRGVQDGDFFAPVLAPAARGGAPPRSGRLRTGGS
ncbi:hypothetical protein ACIGW7_11680 [Streptomyces sp. NPDC053253]|uniref:hypothetical protein n=1 Tax=Streptomyces sp. NPDC053253 TaxID=3365699 RepID=UPI0037D5A829